MNSNIDNSNKQQFIKFGQIEIKDGDFRQPDLTDVPLLPTRDVVLFPAVVFPLTIGREASRMVAQKAFEQRIQIAVVCQRESGIDNPAVPDDLFRYGVLAKVMHTFDLPDGNKAALLMATQRIKVLSTGQSMIMPGLPSVSVELYPEPRPRMDMELKGLISEIRNVAIELARSGDNNEETVVANFEQRTDPVEFVNLVSTQAPLSPAQKMELLGFRRIRQRAMHLLTMLSHQQEMAHVIAAIRHRTHENISGQQRAAFLQQQMEAIRQELYGDDDEVAVLKTKADCVDLSPAAREVFDREVEKLRRLSPQSPDYSVLYNYLELLISLPWGKIDPLDNSIAEARDVLDADHYGLEKIKERIIEQLAVLMNTPDGRSPIICLVGAPGVGKTSLGASIAKALGRKYQRVSMGGMHDEAEIRGHRRTYIGAMPGRIIDAIRRAGSANPVILLDEIDKIASDFKGDPSAALLEVLDPEQNSSFHDNYIDVDFDLSKVLFIASANTLGTVSSPLLDRMEIINISGYLLEEKVEIARRHLLPRLLKRNNLTEDDIVVSPEAIIAIIEGYTDESGVRQLEKQLAKVVRRIVLRRVSGQEYEHCIKPQHLQDILGVETYSRDRYEGNDFAGVVTGLAWTAAGGEILYIESSPIPGKNGDSLTLTGNLGNVMKESAHLAMQYIRSHAVELGVNPDIIEQYGVHLHVPEGAIPKDGPSAGVTIVTSIVSALTRRRIAPGIAMSGEITLRGKVLPVGGIKEKILAAKRAGINRIILSERNRKNVGEIPAEYLKGLTFEYVDTISDVIRLALTSESVGSPLPLKSKSDNQTNQQ